MYIVFQFPRLVDSSKDLPTQEQIALLAHLLPGASSFARYAVDDCREPNRDDVLALLSPVTPATLTSMVPSNKEYISLVQKSIRNFVDAEVLVYH